ncbi:PDC sensor domain-containing protein, partial [Azospirillum sp.]|uniref:PDC sensor domain-containing protein n=1 Tax=Azospirillum sp. TaxID=34012 RepID=UPI002D57DA4B
MFSMFIDKARSLTGKLIACIAVILAMVATIGVVVLVSRTDMVIGDLALKHGQAIGEHHATRISSELNRKMSIVETVARAFATSRQRGVVDRASYSGLLRAVMENDPSISSMWVGFEPDAVDVDVKHIGELGSNEKGRFLAQWYREAQQLTVRTFDDPDTDKSGAYFYQGPKQLRRQVITEPFWYPVGGQKVLMTSLAAPVVADGRFLGVVGLNVPLAELSEAINNEHPYETGSLSLISHQGNWAGFRVREALGKPISEFNPGLARILPRIKTGEAAVFRDFAKSLNSEVQTYQIPIHVGSTGMPWALLVALPLDKVYAPSAAIRDGMIVGSVVAVLLLAASLGITAYVTVRRPLARTVGVIDQLSAGKYRIEIPDVKRPDEIGQVSRALLLFKDNLERIANLETERREHEERAEQVRKQELMEIANAFEAAL